MWKPTYTVIKWHQGRLCIAANRKIPGKYLVYSPQLGIKRITNRMSSAMDRGSRRSFFCEVIGIGERATTIICCCQWLAFGRQQRGESQQLSDFHIKKIRVVIRRPISVSAAANPDWRGWTSVLFLQCLWLFPGIRPGHKSLPPTDRARQRPDVFSATV